MYIQWNTDKATDELGNKAANLCRLKQMGIAVPEGFTLTKKAFLDFVSGHQIRERIMESLLGLPSDLLAIKERSQDLYSLFNRYEIPDKISKEITQACEALRGSKEKVRFAIRSSAGIEDLSSRSFAGMYKTFLNVETTDEVLRCIKGCWQSAFSFSALSYIKRTNIDIKRIEDTAMAVIIQRMIKAKFSGVMMTIDPITGDPSKILIEYTARGNVVSGEITPNRLLVDKITHQIDKTINSPEAILAEEHIFSLQNLAKRIEAHFGGYQDIEWAIDEGVIILQARPETVWSKR
ncbi:MAG: PEP/pyruvate-binding domain-containing protein [bacterium]